MRCPFFMPEEGAKGGKLKVALILLRAHNHQKRQIHHAVCASTQNEDSIMTLHRRTYYGLIHHGMKALLLDRIGHFTEDEHHHYLGITTGKTTCFSMTDDELEVTVENLRTEGYLEDMKRVIAQFQGAV
ncbi:hypothetical protein JRK37_002332 [Vibrio vulnificus]|nr:hypothetical protein [Vibrio vulnificus]